MLTDEKIQVLRGLMDALPEGIVSMDMQGNITHTNKVVKDLLGFNTHNIIGKPIFDFAPSASRKDLKDLFAETVLSEKIRDRNIRLYDFRGQLRDLKLSTSLIRGENGDLIGVVATLRDVKSEARLERELDELQEFSQSLFNNPDVGIIATDLGGDIVFASRGASKIFKKSPEKLKGQNLIKDFPDPLILNEKFMNLVKTGKSFEYESEILEKKGSRNFKYLFSLQRDRNGKPTGTIVVFNEISKLREAERNLKDTADVLRRYTRDLESLVGLVRNLGTSLEKDRTYKIMGEGLKRILGVDATLFFRYSEEKECLVLDFDGESGFTLHNIDSVLKKSGFLLNLKKPRIVKDLSSEKSFCLNQKYLEREMRSAVFVPISSKGETFGILAAFYRDSKVFKKEEIEILQSVGSSGAVAIENATLYQRIKDFASELEKKVEERTADLEQSNRLKDLFIDIMKHDLLKPADIARLSTELVLDLEEDSEKKEILENILQSNIRIINLIENASVLAKLESGEKLKFKQGDLGKILGEVENDLSEHASERNTKIRVSAPGSFPAMVNPLIYNVFSNLLDNAIKYGPEDSEVAALISEGDSVWRISVADRGKGVPDRHKEAIFDRFKRFEKGGVRGSGLGLAIVKKVVEVHKGRVWVEDNPEGGSIFYVEIPKH